MSALCLWGWALTQQSEGPVGCALVWAQPGWEQAVLNYQKHPWPVSWAWCLLSLTSGDTSSAPAVSRGEAVCTWGTTHESQHGSLLPGLLLLSPFLLLCSVTPSSGAVASWPLSTLWGAAANGPPLPECDQKLSTHIFFQLAREAAVSGERWCWQLGLLATAQGTYSGRLCIKCSPPPTFTHLLLPFPSRYWELPCSSGANSGLRCWHATLGLWNSPGFFSSFLKWINK